MHSEKTIVFCTSFMRDQTSWNDRYKRWLDYYADLPIDCLGMFMIDDGSPYLPSNHSLLKVINNGSKVCLRESKNFLIHFPDNLGRRGLADYPGWWRSFLHSIDIADQLDADKIIHIESDAYILSRRLLDFVNDTRRGWHALWSKMHGFPETAIQIICRDQFSAFKRFRKHSGLLAGHLLAEHILPFTAVHNGFKGDRYSEFGGVSLAAPLPADADYATQVTLGQRVAFRP